MASIEKQANGRWRARYRTPSGESRSKTFKLKKDATKFLLSKEHSKESGQFVDVRMGRTTVEAWADTWMETVEPALTAKTAASYRSLLRSRILPTFGRRQLATLKPSDVQAWVSTMRRQGLSASRIRQAVVLLRQMLEAATRDGMVGRNACAGVKLPKLTHREAAYFDPQTVEAIAKAVGAPHDLLVSVLGTCGLR